MTEPVSFFKIFLSSPGDVPQERDDAEAVIREINESGEFASHFLLKLYRWDDRKVVLPMPVTNIPQRSVDIYMTHPSECDLVVVLFWARMGSPLVMDECEYLSGTHYEYSEALQGYKQQGKPDIWLYRCADVPSVKLDDPQHDERIQQFDRVVEFFKQFQDAEGRYTGGVNQYAAHADFKEVFKGQLITQLRHLRDKPANSTERKLEAAMPSQTLINTATEVWAKISRLDTDGLRGELPAEVASGDVIEKEDTRQTNFPIEFPRDEQTRKLLPGMVCLEVKSNHFRVHTDEAQGQCAANQIEIAVSPTENTPTIIFDLEPVDSSFTGRARVRVTAMQDRVVVARLSISTDVVKEIEKTPKWLLKALNLQGVTDEQVSALRELIQSALASAQRWQEAGKPTDLLMGNERAEAVRSALAELGLQPDADGGEWSLLYQYLQPEQWHLLRELDNPETSPARRVSIGDRLAVLGDPRPGVGLRPDGLPDIDWVKIPAGPFLMGDDRRRADLPYAYSMAKYPVTYAQYEAFVNSDGYSNRSYWTEAGWAWKKDKTEPEYLWQVPKWHISNRPVVAVTWYEAVAFCRWLSAKLGYEVRLPSEAEWEKAARGTDGRIYPYGNEFDAAKGNTWETGIRQTSAVGIFPEGASPYGVQDMSGNVWEWCLTKWRDGYMEVEDNDLEGTDLRVLRGGSFSLDRDLARAACRDYNGPYSRNNFYGFRVGCRPPSQGR